MTEAELWKWGQYNPAVSRHQQSKLILVPTGWRGHRGHPSACKGLHAARAMTALPHDLGQPNIRRNALGTGTSEGIHGPRAVYTRTGGRPTFTSRLGKGFG